MMESGPGALDDIRVLDLTGQIGQYATKLLADLGADVIRIEPPAGSPARLSPPFYLDDPNRDRSLDFWYFNTNKRSVTLNLGSADGQALFRALLAKADVLVESFPLAETEAVLPAADDLRALNPRLIHCSITGFGTWGPHAEYIATDLVGVAMSGVLTLAGYPDRAPTMPPGNQGYIAAGVQAAQGILAALLHRDRTGHGQRVEVSMQEALSMAQETAMQFWDMRHELRRRAGDARTIPGVGTYACKDGHVYLMVTNGSAGAPWSVLTDWMAQEGMAGDLTEPPWQELLRENLRALVTSGLPADESAQLRARFAHVNAVLEAFLLTKTKDELYEQGQGRRLLIGPVNSANDLLHNHQLNARGWYQQVEHPELGVSVIYPGPPYRHAASPWRLQRRPPRLGEHTVAVLRDELGLTDEQMVALKAAGVT